MDWEGKDMVRDREARFESRAPDHLPGGCLQAAYAPCQPADLLAVANTAS
jgi:hypothetical protein